MLSDRNIREQLGTLHENPVATEEEPQRRKKPGVVWLLAVLAVALWAGGVGLIVHLEKTSPQAADAASGQVYRFRDLPHAVYLTAGQEHEAYSALLVPAVMTVVAAIAAAGRKRPEKELL